MAHVGTNEQELDLALAAELQAALLPKACPTDCPHHIAAARNRMCAGVGGDFYDFMRINEDQIGLVIGDVMGHGVRASLIMAQIMGFLHSHPLELSRPVSIVAAVNEMLIGLGNRIGSVLSCSLLYVVIDVPTGIGLFVNAGHLAPFICRRRRTQPLHLEQRNMVLGVEEFTPVEACHTFSPAERLVMFTDGIIDAANPAGGRFGDDRLHAVVDEYLTADPDTCAEAVFRAVAEFRQGARQTDDETIVVIDRV
ncbi:MAG: serine/threonine-protein phosphatase [Planctomycetes bacterium]|nr:serine/threonine-protein phosphatase [Planctomycetota bacterium]